MADLDDHDLFVEATSFGAQDAGKSYIGLVLNERPFSEVYIPTIVIDFNSPIIHCGDIRIKAKIWDTSGLEPAHGFEDSYNGRFGTQCLIGVIPMDSPGAVDNFASLQLTKFTRNKERFVHGLSTPLIIVGSKMDLCDADQRAAFAEEVQKKIVEDQAELIDLPQRPVCFVEVSAKTGEGLDKFRDVLCGALQASGLRRGEFAPWKKDVVVERVREMVRDGVLFGDWGSVLEEE